MVRQERVQVVERLREHPKIDWPRGPRPRAPFTDGNALNFFDRKSGARIGIRFARKGALVLDVRGLREGHALVVARLAEEVAAHWKRKILVMNASTVLGPALERERGFMAVGKPTPVLSLDTKKVAAMETPAQPFLKRRQWPLVEAPEKVRAAVEELSSSNRGSVVRIGGKWRETVRPLLRGEGRTDREKFHLVTLYSRGKLNGFVILKELGPHVAGLHSGAVVREGLKKDLVVHAAKAAAELGLGNLQLWRTQRLDDQAFLESLAHAGKWRSPLQSFEYTPAGRARRR